MFSVFFFVEIQLHSVSFNLILKFNITKKYEKDVLENNVNTKINDMRT